MIRLTLETISGAKMVHLVENSKDISNNGTKFISVQLDAYTVRLYNSDHLRFMEMKQIGEEYVG